MGSPKWVFIIISHKDFIITNSPSNRDFTTSNNQRAFITINNQKVSTTNNNHKDFITTKRTRKRRPQKKQPQRTFQRHGKRTKTLSPSLRRQRNTHKPRSPPS